jgi:hypothetical protein
MDNCSVSTRARPLRDGLSLAAVRLDAENETMNKLFGGISQPSIRPSAKMMDGVLGQQLPRKQILKLTDWRAKLRETDEPRSSTVVTRRHRKRTAPLPRHPHFGATFGSLLPSLAFFQHQRFARGCRICVIQLSLSWYGPRRLSGERIHQKRKCHGGGKRRARSRQRPFEIIRPALDKLLQVAGNQWRRTLPHSPNSGQANAEAAEQGRARTGRTGCRGCTATRTGC